MSPDSGVDDPKKDETKYVFISHAAAEADIVARVRDDLEADGINCWMAPRDVPPGGKHTDAIPDAIASCPVFLLFVSKRSLTSDDVEREVHLAADAKALIIPIRLEAVELTKKFKYLLAQAQWIDAFPRIELILPRLREAVREALRKNPKIVFPFKRRSRVRNILVVLGAWVLVAALDLAVLELIRRVWFNMLPYGTAILAALRTPLFFLMAAVPPLAALALQFWANRNPVRIFTLDALFSLTPGPARTRFVAAAAITALGLISAKSVPTASITAMQGATPGNDFFRVENCDGQASSYYRVDMRVGSGNPAFDYVVNLTMEPDDAVNGVKFCQIWLDRALVSGHPDRTPYPRGYTISQLRTAFPGSHSLFFTVAQSGSSNAMTTVRAILTGPRQAHAHEAIELSPR